MTIRAIDEYTGFLAPGHLQRFHDELSISYGALGVVMAMPYLGGLVSNVVLVRTDGTDRKRVCVGGAIVTAIAMLLIAFSTGLVTLCAATLLFGVAVSCLVDGGEIVLANATDGPLERILARVNLGGTFGDLAGPLVIAGTRWLGVEWRWLFGATSIAIAVYAAVLSRQTFSPAREVEVEVEVDAPAPTSVLRHRAIWWLGVAALIGNPLDEPFLATLLAFVERDRAISGGAAQLLGAAFVVGGLSVYTVLVRHLEARHISTVFMLAGLMMATSAFATLFVPVWAIALVGLMHSTALNGQWLVLQAAALRVAPGREGSAGALIDTIELVSLVVPVAFGFVAQRHGLGWSIACYSAWPLLYIVPAIGLRRERLGTKAVMPPPVADE